jgi:hypothetical protein
LETEHRNQEREKRREEWEKMGVPREDAEAGVQWAVDKLFGKPVPDKPPQPSKTETKH